MKQTAVEQLGIAFRQWQKDWDNFEETGKDKPVSYDEFMKPFLEMEKNQQDEKNFSQDDVRNILKIIYKNKKQDYSEESKQETLLGKTISKKDADKDSFEDITKYKIENSYSEKDMENTKKSDNDQAHLEILIRRQKQSNDLLRQSAVKLHSFVEKLSGEFPALLFEYDNQEKLAALSHIDKLEMNGRDYDAIVEDINYSLSNLDRSI